MSRMLVNLRLLPFLKRNTPQRIPPPQSVWWFDLCPNRIFSLRKMQASNLVYILYHKSGYNSIGFEKTTGKGNWPNQEFFKQREPLKTLLARDPWGSFSSDDTIFRTCSGATRRENRFRKRKREIWRKSYHGFSVKRVFRGDQQYIAFMQKSPAKFLSQGKSLLAFSQLWPNNHTYPTWYKLNYPHHHY